ncbi:MAG: alpha/beta fold hydrolase [Deltaproteobacteria bacterium]|nr:MAG: alpha/beta fold hydrolase [Deltaproteobacteria bacterium]
MRRAILLLVMGCLGWYAFAGCGTNNKVEEGSSQESSTEVGANAEANSDASVTNESQPDPPKAWVQPFEPAVCGVASYSWLSPETMGGLVEKKKQEVYSLPKEGIEALLKAAKYDKFKIKYGVSVYQFRYETQVKGKKVEATGVMAFPQVTTQEKPTFPYILWLHGTSGFSDSCAPSRKQDGPLSVALLASQGYIAVAPDYIGMNGSGAASTTTHPYVVGEPTAMGSWDSIRAAGKLLKDISAPVTADNQVVLWGGSQGGHAAMFSLLYASYYAPEFSVAAVIAAIAPLHLPNQVLGALKTLDGSTLLLAAIAIAFSRWYGKEDRLTEILTNKDPNFFATELPKIMDSQCGVDEKKFQAQTASDVFTEGFIKAVEAGGTWKGYEDWYCMFAENSMLLSSVKKKDNTPPILFVVSENDELVDTSSQYKMYDELCKNGYNMEYLECKGSGHAEGAIWSLPEQFDWVAERLTGKPISKACQRTPPVCCSGSNSKVCTP